jgi:hypothetical protein
MILRPLTAELDSKDSPVRLFLDDRFTNGLRDVQRRYRQAAPPFVVPSANRQEANRALSGRQPTGSCGLCCTRGSLSRSQQRVQGCADAVPVWSTRSWRSLSRLATPTPCST